MLITYNDSEQALSELNSKSTDEFYWDGWDICRFKSAPAAIYDKSGRFRDPIGWGYLTKYSPNSEGNWEIDLDH